MSSRRRGVSIHPVEAVPQRAALILLAERVRHTVTLAAMALRGNDPAMGVEYLRDSLEALRDGLDHH